MTCKCYHAERNFLGKIGVCWGTKECEACSCGGDESKCDFYEDKRKKVIPKTTNADRVRSMTDEELAVICEDGCPPNHECPTMDILGEIVEKSACQQCWLEWLKAESRE